MVGIFYKQIWLYKQVWVYVNMMWYRTDKVIGRGNFELDNIFSEGIV